MKNLLIPVFLLSLNICPGQNECLEEYPRLNYLFEPVETEVIFDFGQGLMKDTDFDMDYRRMILPPLNKDTTLEMGAKEYKVKLPLERPTLIRIHIADQWDHLFLIPGQTTHVIYNPLKENQNRIDVISPENVKAIDKYYDARFDLLGVDREILQAYSTYNHLSLKPMTAKKAYDSLAKEQYDLLTTYASELLKWFVDFERKSIKYLTETFKLGSIGGMNLDVKGHYVDDYSSFELSQDLNDTIGLLTNFYVWSLGELGYLTHCKQDCFDDLEIRLPAMGKAMLRMAEDIQNPDIKQVFLSKNLIRMYRSSPSLPDSIVQAFENKLDKPYLNVISIYKNPPLIGTQASSFYLGDPSGKFHTIKDLKGQVVLLNFWFVGCKPCEKELPYEKKLVKDLADTDFKLVNICTNTPEDTWKEFVRENDMPGLNLYAKGNWQTKLADSYHFSSYPTYVLIGKDGKVVLDKAPRPSGDSLVELIRDEL